MVGTARPGRERHVFVSAPRGPVLEEAFCDNHDAVLRCRRAVGADEMQDASAGRAAHDGEIGAVSGSEGVSDHGHAQCCAVSGGASLQRLVPEAEREARRASLTGRKMLACVGGPQVVCSVVGSAEAAWWDCADLVWVLGRWVEGLECELTDVAGVVRTGLIPWDMVEGVSVSSWEARGVLGVLGTEGTLPHLRRLRLSRWRMEDAEDMKLLLEHAPNLQSVSAIGLDLRDEGSRVLLSSLPLQVTSVEIGECRISADCALALSAHLGSMPRLTALGVWWTSLGHEGISVLSANLHLVPLLRSLDLGDTCMGSDGTAALAAGLAGVPLLTRLGVADNAIGSAGARALAAHLHCVPALAQLIVWGNDIGAAGMAALSAHLHHVSRLTSLDVGCNGIGAVGMRALSAHLQCVPLLTNLHAEGNGIGDEGMRALSERLNRVPLLASLDLWRNGIGAAGLSCLCAHLSKVPHLTILRLSENDIPAASSRAAVLSAAHQTPGRRKGLALAL